jgi:4-amino-4-deoxy-L-arabinose transferase-like glycosyltransferase
VLNLMQALLLGLGIFALGKRVGGPAVGALSALILYGSPIVLITGVLPMVDVPLTLVLVAATLAMVEALDAPADHRWLLLAGTLLGVGFGVKYLALAYAAALAPIGIVALHRAASGSPERATGLAASVGLCFLLAASPWIAKNTLMFGNPVFPYLSAPRVEPWLRPLYPALRPVGVDTALFSVHNEMRKAVTPTRLFLHPEQLEADVDRHDSAPYLPLVLVPLALLLPERRRIAPVLLPALGYVALLLAYSPYTSIRYLMPMLPGLSIALAVLCVAMARRLSRLTRAVAGVTMLVLALPVPLALITRAQWKQAIPHVMGLVSDRAVLDGYWDTSDYMDVVRWTDAHAPAGAPVILLFEGRGFYFRSTVYEDILLRNWAYLSEVANDGSCLAATGARFMILNDDGRRYFLSRGVKPEALQWDKFQAFRERCLDLRYQNAKFEVFALKPTG